MIYTIGTQKLYITDKGSDDDKGSPNQIVGWRDVAETCKTLHAVCNSIDIKSPDIVDGIARSGFWAAVFRDVWSDCQLHLNDLDENCNNSLYKNFPEATITNHSIHEWVPPKDFDIALLDFDHFTLKIIDKFTDVLVNWSKKCKYLIIADGACFGFKFGNMKHYGIDNERDYYYALNDYLVSILDKEITTVSKFVNAATILLEPKSKKKTNIKFLDPTPNYPLRKEEVEQEQPKLFNL